MRKMLVILAALAFVATAPVFAEVNEIERVWMIEDSPVPLDDNFVRYRLVLDVSTARTCTANFTTDFYNVDWLFSSKGAVSDVEIGGVGSQSTCSISTELGDECATDLSIKFYAEGRYEVLFLVATVEIAEIGNHWDEDGSNPGVDPGSFWSPLHHTTIFTQNCGEIVAWEVDTYSPDE